MKQIISSPENRNRAFYLFLSAAIYVVAVNLPFVNLIIMPVMLLCTFLHEFGHAFFALITGGTVKSLAVHWDGSGLTTTLGGSAAFITFGGYVGSALFGNLMLRLAGSKASHIVLKTIAVLMFFSSIIWFAGLVTTGILLVFSVALWFTATKKMSSYILSFLGVACVIYIIQDFNVGPTSDLQAYQNEVGIFPAKVWMYIWLLLVIGITALNLRAIFRKRTM